MVKFQKKRISRVLLLLVVIFSALVLSAGIFIRQKYGISRKLDKIAYVSSGNIWIVNPDGTGAEKLTDRKFVQLKNAKRTFCPEGDVEPGDTCHDVDVSGNYFVTFFDKLSISPDGTHLAAMGFTDSVKKAIESTDEKLRDKYLTGDYWNPGRFDLYIFDLVTKSQKIINLEEKVLGENGYPGHLLWTKDNKRVIVHSSGSSDLHSVDVESGKNNKIEAKFEFAPDYQNLAYSPSVGKIFYEDITGKVFKKDTLIESIDINKTKENHSSELNVLGEFPWSNVVSGTNGNIYFITASKDKYFINSYNYIAKDFKRILEIEKCNYNDSPSSSCFDLPEIVTGDLSFYSDRFISPDGKYIIASQKNEHGIYLVDGFKKVAPLDRVHELGFKWGLDGHTILSVSQGKLIIYNLETGKRNEISIGEESFIQDSQFDWNYLD